MTIPYQCWNSAAVALNEKEIFICIGGNGKGSDKCGIINIESGNWKDLTKMNHNDYFLVQLKKECFKDNLSDHLCIIAIGARHIQV